MFICLAKKHSQVVNNEMNYKLQVLESSSYSQTQDTHQELLVQHPKLSDDELLRYQRVEGNVWMLLLLQIQHALHV